MLVLLALPWLALAHALVQPEVLVVVDPALHASLGGSLATTTQYVTNFWSAVNLRFSSLTSPAVELVVVGVEVGSAPYLRPGPDGKFEAPAALDRMGKHFYTRSRGSWDLVVTMTGLDMCRRKAGSSSCNSATAGYAYVGGACVANSRRAKVNSVALVEDNGGYGGVVVAAHEVAHLLGVAHDGDTAPAYLGGPGAASCPWSRGFIMSDRRRGLRGLAWSTCSQRQLRHFAASPAGACLAASSRAAPAALTLLPTAASLAPLVASADAQCVKEAGAGSRACFSDARVCTQLFCVRPATGGCVSYRPAVEGTACGRGGHCSAGTCLEQNTATKTKQKKKKTSTIVKTQKWKGNKSKTTSTTNIINTKVVSSPKVQNYARPTFVKLTGFCKDESRINVRGITSCDKLFQSFAFMFCGNERIRTKCCGSHALYCS